MLPLLLWLHPPAQARDIHLEVPFPTAPIYDGADQRICLGVNVDLGVDHTESEAGAFSVSCRPEGPRTEACVALLPDPRTGELSWPERVPPLVCQGDEHRLIMRLVPAFDPTENPWDGVTIARNVDLVRAVFRVDTVPDAVGVLEPPGAGQCGVKDETLWMVVPAEPRRQTCTLKLPEGPAAVPIRLVKRLDTEARQDTPD